MRNPATLTAYVLAQSALAFIVADVNRYVTKAELERRDTAEADALRDGWTVDEVYSAGSLAASKASR